MPPKIKHILIPILIACLFLTISPLPSTGQINSNLLFLPLVSNDLSGWIGPYGGYITSVVVDPSNPQVIFAASWGSGVFRSQDGGNSWQPVNLGLGNLYINTLSIDPSKTTTVFAGTYKNQVYKSMDGGNTWIWSGTGMQDQAVVYSIAIDPVNPYIIYAATRGVSNNGNPPWNGVVYKSVNGGQTWIPVLTNVGGADVQDWVYSLAVNPNDPQSVYAASHEHGPFHSSTYGDSWYSIHDGINDDSGRAIVIAPEISSGPSMYYGVWHFDTVYKSIDGGNDWVPANRGIAYTKVYSMVINPLQTEIVYLATFNNGILKTGNGGIGWIAAGLQDDSIYSIAINPISTSTLYAGTAGNGLHKSVDGGVSWLPANTGIDNSMSTAVLISPSDPKWLFTSIFGAGAYQSRDHGRTWSEMNAGLGDKFVHTLVQDPAKPGVIYALTDTAGLYQYDVNSGNEWVSLGQGLPLTGMHSPAYPEDHPFATHEIQESTLDLENRITANQLASVNLLTMTYAPSDPQIAYMGTGGSGVYKSADGGLSWLPAGLGGEVVQSLAVDKTDPNLVYAAITTSGSMKISPDGGSSWTDASLPVTFYSLATSPTTHGTLYAGTSSGLYLYKTGSWTQLGLADHVVTAIAIDPADPDRIYAGTSDNGAYYTRDAGLSWQTVNRNLDGLTIQSIMIDPTSPGWVYFSTKTHGIYLLKKDY